MKTKCCTKCSKTLPATPEHFHIQARGLYGLRAECIECRRKIDRERWRRNNPIKPPKTEKQCGRCKEVLPLTHEYFYTKTTKKGTIIKKGYKPLSKDSISFRSICIQCHGEDGLERARIKKLIHYGLTTDEEYELLKKDMMTRAGLLGNRASVNVAYKRRKYDYPVDATRTEMANIRRIKNMGYDLETYHKEWKKKWLNNMKKLRKYEYPKKFANMDKLPSSIVNKMQSEHLTDGIIANRLGFKLSEVPKDILELKRKQLKFHRHVKEKSTNTNSK